jgi:SOS-response transcriptional repressor LexA
MRIRVMRHDHLEARERREIDILRYFAALGDRTGPAVRQIVHQVHAAISTVHADLQRLLDAGDLEDTSGERQSRLSRRDARSLRITAKGRRRLLPIAAEIAAGGGIQSGSFLAADTTSDQALLDALALRVDDRLVRIRGQSMLEAGIHDGDLVVVRPQAAGEIPDNTIVVAVVRERGVAELVLKSLQRAGGQVRLVSANADGSDWQGNPYAARTYDPEDVEIVGVLRWVLTNPNRRR